MPRNIKNRQPVPSEAHDESYAPEDTTDWSSVPVNVGDALDELGGKSIVNAGLGVAYVQVADPADTKTVETGALWLQIS